MSAANRTPLTGLIIAGVIIAAVVTLVVLLKPARFEGPIGEPGGVAAYFDMTRPDALIRTKNLARLPADLLRVPLARDVLTEDFVSYYEHHEQKLSISGAVRRIAYEHKLSLPERLVESVFDEPAEVALWRAPDGRLKYFIIAMTRNRLAQALQTVMPILPDTQLAEAGKLGDTDVPVLILRYGSRQLALLAKDNRVVVLSHPGMLLSDLATGECCEQNEAAAQIVAHLLDIKAGEVSPFTAYYDLGRAKGDEEHRIVVSADVYSFGYDAFTAGVEALDFAFDEKGNWQTSALVNSDVLPVNGLDGTGVWAALPHGASLCGLMPVDWIKVSGLVGNLEQADNEQANPLGNLFIGPAAVCWYSDSRLFTPLFAATLRDDLTEEGVARFDELFEKGIGFADKTDSQEGRYLWRSEVPSRHAAPNSKGNRFLMPSLAVDDHTVLFSPDAALVDKALSVSDKVFPSLADKLPRAGHTVALIEPSALSALLSREVQAALPRGEEEEFRNAADAYLIPRLEALAAYPPIRLERGSLPKSGRRWQPLQWESAAASTEK